MLKSIFRALVAALPAVAFSCAPTAYAQNPATINTACGVAGGTGSVTPTAGGSVFGFGSIVEFVTVNAGNTGSSKTFGTAGAQCGSAQIRSNSGAAMTDTLAAPSSAGAGYSIYIANGDSTATDTISAASGQINGAASVILAPGQGVLFATDSNNYYVIAGSIGPNASFNPASPGAIGGTTPGSGAFTTLSATGTFSDSSSSSVTPTSGQAIVCGNCTVTTTNSNTAAFRAGGINGASSQGNGTVCDSSLQSRAGSVAVCTMANTQNLALASGTLFCSSAAPTISSGFGTGASVTSNNGSCSFVLNVGTGGTATSGVIAMNATAAANWNCPGITDVTTTSASVFITKQTGAASTTLVTVGNFSNTGTATAWVASDRLIFSCFGN